MKTLVSQLLMEKGSDVVAIAPTATVFETVKLMDEKGIGSVLILNARGKLAGIFAERDALKRVLLAGKSARNSLKARSPLRSVHTLLACMPEMALEEPTISAR